MNVKELRGALSIFREKLKEAYQQGYSKGLKKGDVQGRRRKLKRDDYGALRIMIDDFLLCRYVLGTGGRLSASVIYHEFVAWWAGVENGPTPTQTMIGKLLSTKLYKYKSGGCVFYRGLTPKDTVAEAATGSLQARNDPQEKAGRGATEGAGC